ncbi:MAG: hypothetical protein ACOYM3_23465 [Terrimicrobiaceae bacterium]
MSRKIDRSRPASPPWWVELHAAMDSPTVEAGKKRERARTTRGFNPQRAALKQPKQKRPLPQGWTEVSALAFRRSVRKATSMMAPELSTFCVEGEDSNLPVGGQ